MLVCEWDIESYVSRINVDSNIKLHTLSFLKGGYISSGGMVGSLFRIITNYVVGYNSFVSAVEDDFFTSTTVLEYDPQERQSPEAPLKPLELDARFIDIVGEFVADELGRRYEAVIEDIIYTIGLLLAMFERQYPYDERDVFAWGIVTVVLRVKKHQALGTL